MKCLISFIVFFISIELYAQTDEVEDKAYFDALDMKNLLPMLEKISPTLNCEDEKLKSELTCFAQTYPNVDEKTHSFFQLEMPLNQIPKEIQQNIPGQNFESSENVFLIIGFPNDNKGFGLWGLIFKNDGDDFGDSHGSSVTIGKRNKEGTTFTLNGITNVFSSYTGVSRIDTPSGKWEEGVRPSDVYLQQYFTNESMINILVDNVQKNKLLYYKAGAGWIQLDSKNHTGLLKATGQQAQWHKALGFYNFDNISDGLGIRNGFSIDTFVGLQKNLINQNSTCRMRNYLEIGGRASTLNDSYFKGEIGTLIYFQKPKSNFSLKLGGNGNFKIHEDGVEKQIIATTGFQAGRFGMDFDYTQKFGDLRNHVIYNTPNYDGKIEPTMTIRTTFILGRFNSRKK